MTIYAVRNYFREGWGERIRLTLPQSKKRAFKEHGPMTRFAIETQIRRNNYGIALLLGSGLVVVDKDGPNQGPFATVTSAMTSITDRGTHEFFQTDLSETNKIKCQGYDVDVLFNGIVVVPPTEMGTGKIREWKGGIVGFDALPRFRSDLLQEPSTKPQPRVFTMPRTAEIESVRKWILKKFAVCGSGGDRETFKVAIKIVSVTRSDFHAALAEIVAWNETNAINPDGSPCKWTVQELEHKIRCAMRYTVG